jgi:hypothetical protein
MILALAGRRIDADNADYKRFPLSAVPRVKERLKKFFGENNVIHLVSSGACGADLLAQEVAEEMNIDRTVVLPFDTTAFRKSSVTDRPGEWGPLYDRLIRNSMNNLIILQYDPQDPKAYEGTNLELLNTAQKVSSGYEKPDVAVLIVWEGKPKDKDDLTLGLKAEAMRRSLETKEINTLN